VPPIEWSSAGPRLLGALILVFCVVFWAFTNRVEPLFVTTGGGLLALGQGVQALAELKQPPPPAPIEPQGEPKVERAK
jgi:hypothetical protein